MFPEMTVLFFKLSWRSAKIFRRLVFPAPEAPIMKVAYPGAANPETLLRIVYRLISPIAGFSSFSCYVVLTSTSKRTFYHDTLTGYLQRFFALSTSASGSISALVARDCALMVVARCFG